MRRVTHMVMSMTGSSLMASAASSAFSTSSRMVVYKHFPGCTERDSGDRCQLLSSMAAGRRASVSATKHIQAAVVHATMAV